MKTLALVSTGLELQTREALRKLEAEDKHPRVSLFYKELNADRLDEQFLKLVPQGRRLLYKAFPEWVNQIAEAFVLKAEYDAVISWNERLALPFSLLMKLAGSKTPHIGIFSWISGKKKVEFLRQVHSKIDQIVIMSSTQRNIAIKDINIPSSKVKLIKWGVDQKFWRPLNVECDMICSAGSEMRDYPTFIEAMRGLNVPCHIAAGTQRNVIHPTVNAIWKSGELPPNVTVGRKGFLDLRGLYARSRFVVLPLHKTDSDHGATTILEAMAMGKAVICSRTMGQVDVIQEGKTGLFVTQGDPMALRQAIQHLLDNPEIAEQMGNEGRRYIEKYHTLDSFVSNVKHIVTDAIEQKKELPLTRSHEVHKSVSSFT